MGHRANRRIVGAERRARTGRRALDELANGLIAKVLARVGFGDGGQDPLARMLAGQAEDTLNEANGADTARRQRRVGPLLERGPDALALPNEAIDKRLLPRGGLGLAGARRIEAVPYAGVHGDERVTDENADQVRVPAHPDVLPQERQRHGIERAADFDVAIGVDRALAAGEARKRLGRQRLQR